MIDFASIVPAISLGIIISGTIQAVVSKSATSTMLEQHTKLTEAFMKQLDVCENRCEANSQHYVMIIQNLVAKVGASE